MALEMETQHCDNCKKDVPVQNYLHHSIHCPRNIRLCPKCDEPYPIVEMDSHIAEDHVDVVCPGCYEFMEAVQLAAHQTHTCPKRMVSCLICEVDLPADTLLEHIDYCGSRSDRCDGCGKTVLMKYQAFHLSTRHKLAKPETEAQVAQINSSFIKQCTELSGRKTSDSPSSSANGKPTNNDGRTNGSVSKDANTYTSSQSSSVNRSPSNLNGRSSTTTTSQSSGSSLVNIGHSNKTAAADRRFVDVNPIQPTRLTRPSSTGVATASAPTKMNDAPSASNIAPTKSHVAPSNSSSATSTTAVDKTKVLPRNVDSVIADCVSSIAASLKLPHNEAGNHVSQHQAKVPFNGHNASNMRASSIQDRGKQLTASPKTLTAGKLARNGASSGFNNQRLTHPGASSVQSSERTYVLNHTGSNVANSASSTTNVANRSNTAESNAANTSREVLCRSNEVDLPSNPDGVRSRDSLFRTEVLVPQNSEPKITAVNQAPLKTRKMNFSEDALNEYMLRLEEQGLSNGLSTDSSHLGRNSINLGRKSASTSGSSTSRNVIKERAAEIRREREERLASARASNTPSIDPMRSHISQAINLTQPNDAASLTSMSLANTQANSHEDNSLDSTNALAELYDLGLLPRANNNLVEKLTRSMSTDRPPSNNRTSLTRSGSSSHRARPSNFQAIAPPRPRREHEVLTRNELRGLNETLDLDRQVHNQGLEEDGGLCLPCEFCEAPIPMDHLILHQTGCRPDLIYH